MGRCLTEDVTRHLDAMKVRELQVTIDGPPPVHDVRRFHLKHGGSHHAIQANLDRLMLDKQWQGGLKINYVVDEENADFFNKTYDYWSKRYPGRNVKLGATFRDATERGRTLPGCFSREQEVDFHLEQYRQGRESGVRLLPKKNGMACLAACRNAFVVGARRATLQVSGRRGQKGDGNRFHFYRSE